MPELHVVGDTSPEPDQPRDYVDELVNTAIALADTALWLNDPHGMDVAANYLGRAANIIAHEKGDLSEEYGKDEK